MAFQQQAPRIVGVRRGQLGAARHGDFGGLPQAPAEGDAEFAGLGQRIGIDHGQRRVDAHTHAGQCRPVGRRGVEHLQRQRLRARQHAMPGGAHAAPGERGAGGRQAGRTPRRQFAPHPHPVARDRRGVGVALHQQRVGGERIAVAGVLHQIGVAANLHARGDHAFEHHALRAVGRPQLPDRDHRRRRQRMRGGHAGQQQQRQQRGQQAHAITLLSAPACGRRRTRTRRPEAALETRKPRALTSGWTASSPPWRGPALR
ncbi:hypothetical protein [Xanthomonas graminis]|uniref:hypothetical protein n=1 Tax=Xanthomonas graminis TaxID=3390026 RepID=UPI00396484FC